VRALHDRATHPRQNNSTINGIGGTDCPPNASDHQAIATYRSFQPTLDTTVHAATMDGPSRVYPVVHEDERHLRNEIEVCAGRAETKFPGDAQRRHVHDGALSTLPIRTFPLVIVPNDHCGEPKSPLLWSTNEDLGTSKMLMAPKRRFGNVEK